MISSKEYDFKTLKDYAIGYINIRENGKIFKTILTHSYFLNFKSRRN